MYRSEFINQGFVNFDCVVLLIPMHTFLLCIHISFSQFRIVCQSRVIWIYYPWSMACILPFEKLSHQGFELLEISFGCFDLSNKGIIFGVILFFIYFWNLQKKCVFKFLQKKKTHEITRSCYIWKHITWYCYMG